ncbi:MAG: GNAT family N-acetyltransferase [Solirubrobacteraceae bacterium]
MSPEVAYPAEQSVDVPLLDGSTVHIRPVLADDREAIRVFLESLSAESRYYRTFGIANMERLADWSVDVDYADRYGVLATRGGEKGVVGHAAYVRSGRHSAEVAFEVADALHGRGIATLMLAHLAGMASRHGITTFQAEVMYSNQKMIEVFRQSGFPIVQHSVDGVASIELPTSLSEETLQVFEGRAQKAAIGAVRSFLAPASVAVIGASRRQGSVGAETLHNILAGRFAGSVYAINPHAETIEGLPAYSSITQIGKPVELAVVIVPAPQVLGVARECAAAGVRALLVISSGFAERGPEGWARQRELLQVCREAGMRLIGPNCFGVFNTDPEVRLNATFAAHRPPPGRIGFLSQSGGIGIALMEAADHLDLGLSTFVSVGNKADISSNDLLQYWENDPATDVILLYLESFGNPRRFTRIARRVSAQKPILAVKSGRSAAGARATSSHTGAIVNASDVSIGALFQQAGVIRADTIGELLDTAALMVAQPAPRGNRVAIVTNGGGPGVLCADACQSAGLAVPELSVEVRRRLGVFLSIDASLANPVDMIATGTPEQYRRTIEVLVRSGECDAIIALFVPPLMTRAPAVAREIDSAAQRTGEVTLASVFMVGEQPPRAPEGAPAAARFAFPENAVKAIAHAARWSAWRARPVGVVPKRECRTVEAAAIIARALAAGREWLATDEVEALFDCYGLPLIETRLVHTASEAAAFAAEFDGPVALKAVAAELVHKTEVGAVRLKLLGGDEVRAAAREERMAVEEAGMRFEGFAVQPMAPDGVELLTGVVHDANFGPVIVVGAGGTRAELFGDIAVRITPLTDLDAREMLSSLRVYSLLQGFRGQPKCDLAAVEDALLGLSLLVESHPEIAELDANPLIASSAGAVIVDARVRIHPPEAERPLFALS